jgi:A/G-specific adenine glycosylase
VLSIAHALPHGVADGNVIRVVSRLSADASPASGAAFRRRVRGFVEASFGSLHPGWVNQAWMELGALVCTPVAPRCRECPLAEACRARLLGKTEELPVRAPAKTLPVREESALLLLPEGSAAPAQFLVALHTDRGRAASRLGDLLRESGVPLLLVRRPSRGLLGGLWELPGWPLRGEPLRAELAALGIEPIAPLDLEVTQDYSHFRQRLRPVLALFRAEQPLSLWVEQRWVAPADLDRYPRPGAHIKLLRAVKLAGYPQPH